jgi:hypothetical protein
MYLTIQNPHQIKKEKAKMDEKWKNLYKMALSKNPALKEPVLPYS